MKKNERGQALILFAVTVPVLLGILALVLDVGWAHFAWKRAQTAADSAALAAVADAASRLTGDASPECGTLGCQPSSACPSTGNLQTGCAYAAANGFAAGNTDGREIFLSAGINSQPPGISNVNADYWVQATASQQLPQWFSGLFSGAGLRPAVRATAAIRRIDISGSLRLLNRTTDCFASALGLGVICGEDFLALGSNNVKARSGIYFASSNASGIGLPGIAAATVVGNAQFTVPFAYFMGKGGVSSLGSASWSTSPTNGFPDSDYFTDPMSGKGQPPVPSSLPDHPVPGGVIIANLLGGQTVLPPGNYYATLPGTHTPTGLPITVAGNVIFSDGNNPPCGGFCNYVFYGGLVTASLSGVTFSPGRYIFAGAQPVAGAAGVGLSVGISSRIQDLTPLDSGAIGRNTDAGEIFVFTSMNYPGLQIPLDLRSAGISLPQARAGITLGLGGSVTLHGLNASNASLPSELSSFAPVLIWQDQANTTVKYQSNGKLDLSCGGICENILSVPGSQEMIIGASQVGGRAGTQLYGTIYGPRRSWLTVVGLLPGDTIAGPLQIISGSLQMTLNSNLDLYALPNPPKQYVVSLIE